MDPFPPPENDEFPTTRGLHADQKVGQGRFVLRRQLGQGGMGEVWLAIDERLHEETALKFLPTAIRGDVTALDDLRRETIQTRQLSHPYIVRVHDLFDFPGEDPFISMEFVNGRTLGQERSHYPGRVLPWGYLALHVGQLCEALDYAHNEKIIHRDLKPGNILVDFEKRRVKLADFGIARVVTDSVSRVTQQRVSGGTIAYMSLQQLKGDPPRPTDDIYSLGATLYELLTSKPPFHSGDTTWQIMHADLVTVHKRLAEFKIENDVPKIVDDTILACLSRDPNRRPQSAREVAERAGLAEAKGRGRRRGARSPESAAGLGEATATATAPTIRTPQPPLSHADLAPLTPPTPGGQIPGTTPDVGMPAEVELPAEPIPEIPPEAPLTTDRPATAPPATTPPPPASHPMTMAVVAVSVLALLIAAGVMLTKTLGKKQPEKAVAQGSNATQTLPAPQTNPPPARPPDSNLLTTPAATQATALGPGGVTVSNVQPTTTGQGPSQQSVQVFIQIPQMTNYVAPVAPGTTSTIAPPQIPSPPAQTTAVAAVKPEPPPPPPRPSAGQPWTNGLGMRFVPVPAAPTVLFSIWETRLRDLDTYVRSRSDAASLLRALTPDTFKQTPDHPAVRVDWTLAGDFCLWLTRTEQGANRLGPGQRYRLPTDLEWSAAAGLSGEVGSTPSDRSRLEDLYPWGTNWPPARGFANLLGAEAKADRKLSGNSRFIDDYADACVFTAPVGSLTANRNGIYDLGGNVWEWCADTYSRTETAKRVLRGGSWKTYDRNKLRTSYREKLSPTTRADDIGFRCVLELAP